MKNKIVRSLQSILAASAIGILGSGCDTVVPVGNNGGSVRIPAYNGFFKEMLNGIMDPPWVAQQEAEERELELQKLRREAQTPQVYVVQRKSEPESRQPQYQAPRTWEPEPGQKTAMEMAEEIKRQVYQKRIESERKIAEDEVLEIFPCTWVDGNGNNQIDIGGSDSITRTNQFYANSICSLAVFSRMPIPCSLDLKLFRDDKLVGAVQNIKVLGAEKGHMTTSGLTIDFSKGYEPGNYAARFSSSGEEIKSVYFTVKKVE